MACRRAIACKAHTDLQAYRHTDIQASGDKPGGFLEVNYSVRPAYHERVCCLLVLDSVTSTPQWIRQPKPRGCVHDVCVFVCECVLGRSRVSQPRSR